MTDAKSKGLVIAAPTTGSGKTTVSLGLMAAFRKRGLTVQPFKAGPDFIDPAYHERICGRPSINLDAWMTSETFVKETFARHCLDADIAIVEGVMGLFDSAGQGGDVGSTARLAKVLELPVVLVVDAYTCAESAAAILLGCEQYDPGLTIAAAIPVRVARGGHEASIREAIGEHCASPLLGSLPYAEELVLPERQLGLVSVHETGLSTNYVNSLIEHIENSIDLGGLLRAARIGIARDEAFCFYYEDNLRLLREQGVELVAFSPLHDTALPENLSGVYLGGGFPEEFAPRLAENRRMINAIQDFDGIVVGECGGLIYLCEHFVDKEGAKHAMAGLVPGVIEMTEAIQGFGYREVELTRDGPLGPKGTRLRGHEFHWSRWKQRPHQGWGVLESGKGPMGYGTDRLLVSYFHFHLGSNPEAAKSWAASCRRGKPAP